MHYNLIQTLPLLEFCSTLFTQSPVRLVVNDFRGDTTSGVKPSLFNRSNVDLYVEKSRMNGR